jgi:hypothetical protein
MDKTYFKYGDIAHWFLTPNWSPYGYRHDWWMAVSREKQLIRVSHVAPGRICDNLFADELSTMYERIKIKTN